MTSTFGSVDYIKIDDLLCLTLVMFLKAKKSSGLHLNIQYVFYTYITCYIPANRSASVNARSAERGSSVESHLSGLRRLSIENDELLKSDSIFHAIVCIFGRL